MVLSTSFNNILLITFRTLTGVMKMNGVQVRINVFMFRMLHMLVMTLKKKCEFLHIHNWSQIMHLFYLKRQEAGLMTCVPTND